MNVPDKVYYTQTEHVANYFTTGKPFERDCIEYIRKDALLEWLKERRAEHSFEVRKAYQRTIEKIESM